jgi:leucyl-tRNA synthetase
LYELDQMPGWPDSVKTMQRNWIGRSEGVELSFYVEGEDEPLTVFTTRPDTLLGVTYMAVAAEHPLAAKAAADNPDIAAFIEECRKTDAAEATLETMEKKGMALGIDAIHPISGEKVPLWVANFVLMSYGTGAVMAVPAHDERDWEFAKKHGLEIRQVITPADGTAVDMDEGAYIDYGVLVNSGEYDGMDFDTALNAIADHFEKTGRGKRAVNYRLRDWGVSRQRYWGTPIPIIYCDDCDAVPVPEADLPVVLPEDVAGRPVHGRHRARDSAPPVCAVFPARHEGRRDNTGFRALHQSAHAGHGAQRRRQDVQEQGQYSRSTGTHRKVRCRHRSPVHDVRGAAGAGARMVG